VADGGLDVSGLSPSDAAVALRSFPRRFRTALTPAEAGEEVPPAAVAAASDLGRVLGLVRKALADVLRADGPVLPAGVMDAGSRDWAMPADDDPERVLDVLSTEANALAEEIGSVASGDWGRAGQLTGGGSASALDLVREAVRSGHQHLRAAEAAARDR
jgi:hypothetical protein